MSAGDWIGLVAVLVFAVFVGILVVPVLKLGGLLDELRASVRNLTDNATPTLYELTRTVAQANQQIEKVDVVTTHAADASANVSALTSLLAATLGKPLIKLSAFSFAVRKFLKKDRDDSANLADRNAYDRNSCGESPKVVARQSSEEAAASGGSAYTLRKNDPGFFEGASDVPSSHDSDSR